MSPSSSMQPCDLLLSRGKILDLNQHCLSYRNNEREYAHSITECHSAVASLVNLIFRIINQRDRCIAWEVFHFPQRKNGKTETTQQCLLSEARTIKMLPAALKMI